MTNICILLTDTIKVILSLNKYHFWMILVQIYNVLYSYFIIYLFNSVIISLGAFLNNFYKNEENYKI